MSKNSDRSQLSFSLYMDNDENMTTYLVVGKLYFSIEYYNRRVMPSPSASSKFGLSVLKFFKHAQFFMYTQNHFVILKSYA